jgi:cytochrome b
MAAQSEAVQAGGVMPPARPLEPAGATVPTDRVWDPFVRIFHWSLVALFTVSFLTGDEIERLHIVAGYAIIGLLGLRIVWGFVGPRHARFSDFVRPPAESLDYMRKAIRRRAPRRLGHNPAGAIMVITLLTVLIAISATGFMMTTDAFWGAQ